jgi:hypothetical protein
LHRTQEVGGAFVEPEGLVEPAVVPQQVVHVLVAKTLRGVVLPAASGAQHEHALPQRRQAGAGSTAHGEGASEAAPVEGVDPRRDRRRAQGSAHHELDRGVEEFDVPHQLARGVPAQGAHDLEMGRANRGQRKPWGQRIRCRYAQQRRSLGNIAKNSSRVAGTFISVLPLRNLRRTMPLRCGNPGHAAEGTA